MATDRVDEILSFYPDASQEVKEKIAWILMTGKLAGTGKVVILPVDQGVEHGPAASFAPNPAGYDPLYHPQLAIDAGCNAYVAPLGQMEAASEYTKKIPCILKCNSHTLMMPDSSDPFPAITASVKDALRLGCAAVGFTIYPGSKHEQEMYEQLRELRAEAIAAGLAVVVWAYPRGSGLPDKAAESAVDVIAYAAHMAAQLGAHLIKVKPPVNLVALEKNKKVYENYNVSLKTLSDRVSHVVQSAFNGRRIVIFSGEAIKEEQKILEEIRQIRAGGAYGSIVGRNSFQRQKKEAVQLLDQIISIYQH